MRKHAFTVLLAAACGFLAASAGSRLPIADAGFTPTDATYARALMDAALGTTRGSIPYYGASGWTSLTPGTAATLFGSNGAAADPSYQTTTASGNSIYGDGSDGSATLNNTVNKPGLPLIAGIVYQQSRDIYYQDLTLSGSAGGTIISTLGYRIYVSGTLTLTGSSVITASGFAGGTGSSSGAAAGGTAGAANNLGINTAGGAGGNASGGANGSNGGARSLGLGGTGGTGATSTGAHTGGSGGVVTAPTAAESTHRRLRSALTGLTDKPSSALFNGGSGGGGGGSDNAHGGGGGGAGGGVLVIVAKNIVNNATGGSGIQAAGGAGGSALDSTGGKGAGGGGGVIFLVYKTYTGSGALTAAAGANGTTGNATGLVSATAGTIIQVVDQ